MKHVVASARAGSGEPAVGRYAFAYERAEQVKADLSDRRRLIDQGYSSLCGRRSKDVAVSLGPATPDRRTFVGGQAIRIGGGS